MKKARKAVRKARKAGLPEKDAAAEKRVHRFLDLWNGHIREQIKIHQLILKGKESLKHHLDRTKSAHKKFLKQLGKI